MALSFLGRSARFQFAVVDEAVARQWRLETAEVARIFLEDFAIAVLSIAVLAIAVLAIAVLQPDFNHARRRTK